jgi:hypothetical protein
MTRSVAAWEDDGGAGRRVLAPVGQRGNSDKASTASQSVRRKRRQGDGKRRLSEGIVPVIVHANKCRSMVEGK